MGLIPGISTWFQANTSALNYITWHNWAFSSSWRRVLIYTHMSDPSRDTVSKGSMANDSLSSEAGRTGDCNCYYGGWSSRGGSPERSV